jgi:hypothetical protein
VIPKDEQFYDQLIGHLAKKGRVKEDSAHDVLVVSEYDGQTLTKPLRLHVTPESFGPYLYATAPEAAGSYPELHELEAAWRLFLVQLDEAIQAAKPEETELVLERIGVASQAPQP